MKDQEGQNRQLVQGMKVMPLEPLESLEPLERVGMEARVKVAEERRRIILDIPLLRVVG